MQIKRITSVLFFSTLLCMSGSAQVTATVHAGQGSQKISKEIYGQFAEHLGTGIYGGIWVGESSQIPNTNGYRNDVLGALKELSVPVLRWPGGCFADDYHWMDGIGPKDQRPSLRNNNWGGTIEDNSFGTHEFLNLCEMLGCEPYISGNVGSGTVKEMAQWIEYMTSDGDTPMARLRRKNGRDKAWKVKYFGIGNEAWGCGGNMRPEYYSDLFRRFNTYLRDYDGNKLYRIASGANADNTNWTKVCMRNIGNRMQGISVHYYNVRDWNNHLSATKFDDRQYYQNIFDAEKMDGLLQGHEKIMDEIDPKNKISLIVDEWGNWWDEEPGTIRGHLYQQNTLRDAMVAAVTLDVFHRHAKRVHMTNIAQMVNVLQAMILTDTKGSGHMVLTPTYHVFRMYKGFQDATYLPVDLANVPSHVDGSETVPYVSVSAARKTDGGMIISLVNVDLKEAHDITLNVDAGTMKTVAGEILTSKDVHDYNDFGHAETVKPVVFKDAKLKKNSLSVKLPAKSIVVLNIK